MRSTAALVAVLLAATLFASCGADSTASRPKVVATTYPLFEATANVGGKYVHAIDLLPLDPFAAISPGKAEQLRTAPLAIVLGKGTQPEVDKIVAQRTAPTISVLDAVPTLSASAGPNGPVVDPHAWLNPQNMATVVDVVLNALRTLVPSADGKFSENARRYRVGIANVDRDYSRVLPTCKRHELITDNPAFAYLASRFGLQQIPVAPVTGTDDRALREAIADHGPTTVFSSSLPSVDDASRVLDTYGVRVAVLDPIATRTDQARRGGATYGVVMELNLDAIREALGCERKQH